MFVAGGKRQLSQYKAKGKEEGSTLMCDTAVAVVIDAHNQMRLVMRECSELMIHSGPFSITTYVSPEVFSKLHIPWG